VSLSKLFNQPILDELNLKCAKTFSQLKNKAKVHSKNPYLFGISGHDKIIHKLI